MANTSVLTQADALDIYNNKIKPYLNGASHNGCLPVGTIISVFDETAPNHFLICDGTTYNKSDYPLLAAKLLSLTDHSAYEVSGDNTKFKVPDLRGEFLRGTGTNSHTDQGSGANVGVHQDSTKIPYFVLENYTTPKMSFLSLDSNHQTSYISDADMTLKGDMTRIDITGSSGTIPEPYNNQHYTSRPTNTSVLYCIAYENVYVDVSLDGFPVDLNTPTDGQVLTYDATNSEWTNANATGGHTITDETTTYTQREVMEFAAPLTVEDDDTSGSEKTIIGVNDTGELDLSKFVAPSTTKEDWEHIYSTDEQVIGRWIDGKPLYECIVRVTAQFDSNGSADVQYLYISNVDKVLLYDYYLDYLDTYGSVTKLPYSHPVQNQVLTGWIEADSSNKIIISLRGGQAYNNQSRDILAVVKYTKTTDTATT